MFVAHSSRHGLGDGDGAVEREEAGQAERYRRDKSLVIARRLDVTYALTFLRDVVCARNAGQPFEGSFAIGCIFALSLALVCRLAVSTR